MELNNVKLVITDMDGTLLNSQGEVSSQFFELFSELKRHIHFVAASGRQYQSIKHKLESIFTEITIVAENGGLAKRDQQELLFTRLPETHLETVINTARNIEQAEIILCGKSGAFIENGSPEFTDILKEYYHEYQVTEDLHSVNPSEIMKVALYHREDSEIHIYPEVKNLEGELLVKVSGKHWVDISHPEANKGMAVKMIQEQLGITSEETMVFGDYNNDLEMLELGYFSYAMKNAHPRVKELARFETESNDNNGVEVILEQLIKAKITA